jgi:hypothetical protein
MGQQSSKMVKNSGMFCLEVLLLREVQGGLPWALQQLQPHAAAAKQASSTSRTRLDFPISFQWPLLGPFSSSSSSSSTDRRSGSQGCVCKGQAATCYLCTSPPPVTLQQLRLVLEVVCLTCQENTQPALQAPVLLALLLQRAAPGVRAAFLNSADGTRLLVALQQMGTKMEPGLLDPQQTWSFNDHSGALTGLTEMLGQTGPPWLVFAMARAGCILAWSLLQIEPGAAPDSTAAAAAAAASAAAPAAATSGGAAVAGGGARARPQANTAAWVTRESVANGGVLVLKSCIWSGECW